MMTTWPEEGLLHRGAVFRYKPNSDSSQVNLSQQAQVFCGSAIYFLIDRPDETARSLLPGSSTISGSTGQASMLDGQYAFVPPLDSSGIKHAAIVCLDSDVSEETYMLKTDASGNANCILVPAAYRPGRSRIDRLREEPSATDCIDREGWIRVSIGKSADDVTLFIGARGQKTCGATIEAMDRSKDVGTQLHENLTCGRPVAVKPTSAKPRGATASYDTVYLANGGILRGTVFEVDPKRGTSIKLLDGTVRKLKPSEVKKLEIGGGP